MAIGFAKVGASERMRIQIIGEFGVVVNGEPHVPGEIIEVAAGEAMLLLGRGSAKKYVEPGVVAAEPKPAPEPVAAKADSEPKPAPAAKKEKTK